MPLYEYRCKKCGESSEFLQRFDDPPKTECPKCSGELEKLLSAPAFHLKGSGWYKTDYAAKPSAKSDNGAGGDKPADASAKSETSSKSDSDAGSKATESASSSTAKSTD